MKTTISLPIDIPDVKVLGTKINRAGDMVITVESTVKGTKCRECGRKIEKLHGHDKWVELQHLPILGKRSYIRLRPKRYRCNECENKPTTTQKLSWYQGRSSTTNAFEKHVLLQLVNSTIEDTSRKAAVGYDTVVGIIERRVEQCVNWDEFKRLGVLGIDEIALRKGRKNYVAVITARPASGKVKLLAVLPDRKKATVKQFLQGIPRHLQATIGTVCTDMWAGYVNATKEVFGSDVSIVIDRYHVAKGYRDGVDKLRQRECKRLKKQLPAAAYAQLKGVMWAFRKNRRALNSDEKDLLAKLFVHSPTLHLAYALREQLTTIFEMSLTPDEAKLKIAAWQQSVADSPLTCFNQFLTTLDNWLPEILNYFSQRLNSGFVEGFNNKVKTLKRRCYGLFDVSHLFQRLYIDLMGYRLFAHPFF